MDTISPIEALAPVTCVFCEKKVKSLHLKYYISFIEQAELSTKLGDAAVLLYIYYLRMASNDHPIITDETAADSLGWNIRKVRRYRGELIKEGWFRQVSYTRTDGRRGVEYHIGKAAVVASTRGV